MDTIRLTMKNRDGKLAFDVQNKVKFYNLSARLPDGDYTIEITKATTPKTVNQVKYTFAGIIVSAIEQAEDIGLDSSEFIAELIRKDLPSGVKIDKDLMKEILYACCPVIRKEKRITLSKMTKDEASKFIDDCCNLLSAHGVYIAPPRIE